MPIVPRLYIQPSELEGAILRAKLKLQGDVKSIRYSLDPDWSGDPSIFFRVVLTDGASQPAHLRQISQRVALTLMDEVRTDDFGIHAYFDFRSESEQRMLRDPDWD